jgi:uracil-DNA glycosylase
MAHDPGPPPIFEEHFSAAPDYAKFADRFWFRWGPVFYRGRLDGSARVLVIASDPGPTERIAGRCLVGDSGQRVQAFLKKLGLTRSYLCLNAFVYALFPSRARYADQMLKDPEHLAWRNGLYDLARGPDLEAVIAFGRTAQKAVDLWPGRELQHYAPVPHPASRNTAVLLKKWREAVTSLREVVTPDPDGVPRAWNYSHTELRNRDYEAIPAADIPFGFPDWFRDNETCRAEDRRNCVHRPRPDDGSTLIWTAPKG